MSISQLLIRMLVGAGIFCDCVCTKAAMRMIGGWGWGKGFIDVSLFIIICMRERKVFSIGGFPLAQTTLEAV